MVRNAPEVGQIRRGNGFGLDQPSRANWVDPTFVHRTNSYGPPRSWMNALDLPIAMSAAIDSND